MRVFRAVLFALFFANLVASAQAESQSAPPETSTQQPKANVYIYRYKQFVGSALGPSVYCDEVQLARMDNGRYFAVKLDPGRHSFRSNDKQSGVDLELKAGQDYFIRVEIATGFMKGHGRLILTAPEQGRYELQSSKLKPLDASKVVDTARVSVEDAKLDTPVPASPAAAAPQAPPPPQLQSAQSLSTEHKPAVVTISDGVSETASPGDSMSLGEAARRAKQKKAADNGSSTPQ